MEQYREYKDSNVEWIGEIPSHWHISNLGTITTERKRLNRDLTECNVLSLSYGKIKRRVLDNSGLLPASFKKYNIIEKGDIVLRLTDLQNDQTSLRVGSALEKGIITSAYLTLTPQHIEARYLYYILAAFDYWKGFYGLAGGVRESLKYTHIKKLQFVTPPPNEQVCIVSYLDTKTSEIDALIEKCEQAIDFLKDYRRSVVSETVTKGLNPHAPLKDSGIAWIGAIPKHWQVRRVKTSVKRIARKNNTNARVLSLYREYGIVYKDSRDDNHNKTSDDTSNYNYVQANDLVVNKMKAWQGSLAVSTLSGIVSPAYYVYKIIRDDILPRYMHYQLRDATYLPEYRRLSGGIRLNQWDLSNQNFLNIPMLVPSISEQQKIVDYLDTKTSAIDVLIEDHRRQIDLLQEYRRSVISEAVTGKIKVPGVE